MQRKRGLRKVDEMVMQEMHKVTGGLKLPPGLFYVAVAVFYPDSIANLISTAKAAGSRAEDSTAWPSLF